MIDLSIKNAFALIVIMTPEAKASEYVTYEWAFAWGVVVKVIPVRDMATISLPGAAICAVQATKNCFCILTALLFRRRASFDEPIFKRVCISLPLIQ